MYEENTKDTGAKQNSPEGKKRSKLFILIIIGIAAIGIACAALYGTRETPVKSEGEAKGEESFPKTELFYAKGNSLYGFDTNNLQAGSVEYTDHFTEMPSQLLEEGLIDASKLVSKDGKYHFILEDLDTEEGMYTLLSQKGNENPVRVDSGMTDDYVVTDDNKVVYKKNNNLYVSDLIDRKRLDDNITEFYVSADGTHVMWYKQEDSTLTIYYQDIEQKTERIRIERDAEVEEYSENFDNILVKKDNNIYLIQNQTERKRIAENVGDIRFFPIDMEQAQFFFSSSYGDAFVSDLADDSLTENLRRIGFQDMLNMQVCKKEKLYCYSDGELTLIEDGFINRSGMPDLSFLESSTDGNTEVLVYEKRRLKPAGEMGLGKIEAGDVSDSKLVDKITKVSTYLYIDGKKIELKLKGSRMYDMYMSSDCRRIYVILGHFDGELWNRDELVEVSLEKDSLGEVMMIDDNVARIMASVGNNIYYLRYAEKATANGLYELYCNGHYLCSNVPDYPKFQADNSIFCIMDSDSDVFGGEAINGTAVKVCDEQVIPLVENAILVFPFNENSVLILSEYNIDRLEGDLWYYNGQEVHLIDTDVTIFFCPR